MKVYDKKTKCEKCAEIIASGGLYEFKGITVCDDCYIDLLIGIPKVEIAHLSPEIQPQFYNILKNWNRVRPNRHHFLQFPAD